MIQNKNVLFSKVHVFIRENWPIILIFLIGAFIRIFPLRTAYYWDETVYLQNAEVIFSGRTNFSELAFRPPLLSIILTLFYYIYHSLFTAKIVVGLISASTIIGIYLICCKLNIKNVALLSSAIFAFFPFSISNSQLIMTDTPSLALTTFSVYFFISFIQEKRTSQLFLSSFLLALSILMRFTSLIMIPILIMFYILYSKNLFDLKQLICKTKHILVFLFSLTLSLSPYLIWSFFKFGSFIAPFVKAQQIISWSPMKPIYFYFTNINPIILSIFIILIIFAFIFIMMNKKEYRLLLIIFFWLILSFSYLTLVGHKEIRYLTQIITPLLIIVGYSIFQIIMFFKNATIQKYGIAILIIIVISLSFIFTPPFPINQKYILNYTTDSMMASDYLKHNLPTNYVVYTNNDHPVIAFYSNKKIELINYATFPANVKKSYFLYYNESGQKVNLSNVDSEFDYITTIGEITIYGN